MAVTFVDTKTQRACRIVALESARERARAYTSPDLEKHQAELIAYPDLGAEAILRLEVLDFPAVVANDIYGRDLFEEAKLKYQRVSA